MPFAVALFFDGDAETQIRAVWKTLADKGANSKMLDSGIQPHVSMAVYNEIEVGHASSMLASLSREINPFQLVFSSVGAFPGKPTILFLSPAANRYLLELHKRIHTLFSSYEDQAWHLYQQGQWVPHCTLAMDLPEHAVCQGFKLALSINLPITVSINAIGLAEIEPVQQICKYSITAN